MQSLYYDRLMEINKIYQGDCLELMQPIDNKSIDMILCDLPYGTTACKWDTIIPFESLWDNYKRIIKPNGAIVLTASQPFTTALIASNYKMFKYEWIWDKVRPSNPMLAKIQTLKIHENILVFGNNRLKYFPQDLLKTDKPRGGQNPSKTELGFGKSIKEKYVQEYYGYPKSILKFGTDNSKNQHPTQKPVALFEYLIKTYTNENDLVLDNCIGSGTTAIACVQTNRNFIGMELSQEYCDIANKRIKEHKQQLVLV